MKQFLKARKISQEAWYRSEIRFKDNVPPTKDKIDFLIGEAGVNMAHKINNRTAYLRLQNIIQDGSSTSTHYPVFGDTPVQSRLIHIQNRIG